MFARFGVSVVALGLCWLTSPAPLAVDGCCPAPFFGVPVVNSDQTVIVVWDAANKTQHFIRKASFKSEADDFGFLVPSPSQPELEESGNDAFPYLARLTAPAVVSRPRVPGCGCAAPVGAPASGRAFDVKVLEEKLVAGFQATVLEAQSADALAGWLKTHGYAYSPEVKAWAKPYVDAGWKFTALKIARKEPGLDKTRVTASSLRISFKTDRPLFPYREPDYKGSNEKLAAKQRTLRIYFLADARYDGTLTPDSKWSGRVVWAGKVSATDRETLLKELKLPVTTGPAKWWLTEFEDDWAYTLAPADVYFARSANQHAVTREAIEARGTPAPPHDASVYALALLLLIPPLWQRLRRRWQT